jgi:hypothetical protein
VPRQYQEQRELNELTIGRKTLYSQDLLDFYGGNARHIEDKSFNEAKKRYVQEDIAELNMKKSKNIKEPNPKRTGGGRIMYYLIRT